MKRKKASTGVNRVVTFISCILITIVITVGMNWVVFSAVHQGWFEKKPVDTYEYGDYTMNVYHDELPLTIEDMRQTEYEGYSYKETKEQSIFLTQTRFSQYPHYDETEVSDLEYTVTKVHFPWMYDFCLKGIQKELKEQNIMYGYQVEETDASVWNAEKAYLYSSDYGGKDKFLICYPEKIVEIIFGWDATPEDINIAAEVFTEEK